jgi:GNAT superfamily N-acetyltransferase
MKMIEIKKLTPDLLEDYLDFFDHRAFSDGSPFYPCYCSAFNMSKKRILNELYLQAEINGGGSEGWKKALRDSAVKMVKSSEIQGYLAFDNATAVGWCNANDRLNYYRVGEFDLSAVPQDEPCDDCLSNGEVKSVVCFEICPEYRGKGIATLLLDRICQDARSDGYTYVEAYPVNSKDIQALAFTGPRQLYEKAGFIVAAQRGSMLIMRKQLAQD